MLYDDEISNLYFLSYDDLKFIKLKQKFLSNINKKFKIGLNIEDLISQNVILFTFQNLPYRISSKTAKGQNWPKLRTKKIFLLSLIYILSHQDNIGLEIRNQANFCVHTYEFVQGLN
ncbi:hypothetical protein BpHYR1_036491 [Brachionus plicatilis]|uniref:Uncharacterized protein n=1 Tax=Brachionus plicatilis TaxID=10195 RepID=A0A3M7Q0J4_BRAPC|nr:hypothetical protein BpHYR1_036491 [Brachionus plicatilis]